MIFGTRPEIIKLSPVFTALTEKPSIELTCVFTGQQADLGETFLEEFEIPVKYHLDVMRPGQNLSQLLARSLLEIDSVISENRPDGVIVQGDTSSALAGAMVAHLHHVPVWHVEAGLRTNDPYRPFPEETNRVLISRLASLHFAATKQNQINLINEGVAAKQIVVTGNPIVDVVLATVARKDKSTATGDLIKSLPTTKLIVLTAHRRENFTSLMDEYFKVLLEFLDRRREFTLIVPVHPNPSSNTLISRYFDNHPRAQLIEPLGYHEFLTLLAGADLIVSDSGGIQEEAASIGCPLIVLRESTERPEAIECGCAELAPDGPVLASALESFITRNPDSRTAKKTANPFGDGNAGRKIADVIAEVASRRGDVV